MEESIASLRKQTIDQYYSAGNHAKVGAVCLVESQLRDSRQFPRPHRDDHSTMSKRREKTHYVVVPYLTLHTLVIRPNGIAWYDELLSEILSLVPLFAKLTQPFRGGSCTLWR